MSISPQLGAQSEVRLSAGPIRYRERGEGDAIVFVHPMIVNGDMWRKVVPRLAERHRCIAPDWPLGGHEIAMRPDADLSPPGVGRIIAEFLEPRRLVLAEGMGQDEGTSAAAR